MIRFDHSAIEYIADAYKKFPSGFKKDCTFSDYIENYKFFVEKQMGSLVRSGIKEIGKEVLNSDVRYLPTIHIIAVSPTPIFSNLLK